MLCGTDLPLEIVVGRTAGLRNPGRPGRYAVEISTEADPAPARVSVLVR
jgi:hypothetical protein